MTATQERSAHRLESDTEDKMTCTGKHYDCVEQSDCLDCRYRTLATNILNEAHIPAIEPEITILADDLTKVHYEPRIDGAYASSRTVRELFLSRIGGIGALSRYMLCIRKGKR